MLLKEWNATSATDSVAMTLFALTFDRVMAMDRQRDVGNSQRIRGLEATLQELEKAFGTWRVAWGEINRLQRIHGSKIDLRGHGAFSDAQPSLPIAGAPGPLGIVFSFYSVPQAGQKRRYGVAGSSLCWSVAELDSRPHRPKPSFNSASPAIRLRRTGSIRPQIYCQGAVQGVVV